MAKRKTEFKLEAVAQHGKGAGASIIDSNSYITIIGNAPEHSPYVSITATDEGIFFIANKDLERFAVNILKALNSRHLSGNILKSLHKNAVTFKKKTHKK